MEITGIDHLYLETADWPASADFWRGIGFELLEEWGSDGHHAGRFVAGDATIVLAETSTPDPVSTVFFAATGLKGAEAPSVVAPLEPTHWGTNWIRGQDPDGRVHALEETP